MRGCVYNELCKGAGKGPAQGKEGKEMTTISLTPNQARAVAGLVHVASKDKFRPALQGVYVETEDHEVSFTATDSYRLAQWKFATLTNFGRGRRAHGNFNAKELADWLTLQAKAIGKGSGKVVLEIVEPSDHSQYVTVTTELESSHSANIRHMGEFPKYQQLVPADPHGTIKPEEGVGDFTALDPGKLTNLLKSALANQTLASNTVPVKFFFQGERQPALLQCVRQDVGSWFGTLMPVRVK